jgi:hypothetical protein
MIIYDWSLVSSPRKDDYLRDQRKDQSIDTIRPLKMEFEMKSKRGVTCLFITNSFLHFNLLPFVRVEIISFSYYYSLFSLWFTTRGTRISILFLSFSYILVMIVFLILSLLSDILDMNRYEGIKKYRTERERMIDM